MFFESNIIDGNKYRKYKKLRGALFVFWFFIGFPVWFLAKEGDSISNYEGLGYIVYAYAGLVIVSTFVYYVLTKISFKHEVLGDLKVSDIGISISENNEKWFWRFSDLNSVDFIRNTRFHEARYRDEEKIYSGNNFIELRDKNNIEYKFEFLIKDEDHNKEFEEMLKGHKFNVEKNRRFFSV